MPVGGITKQPGGRVPGSPLWRLRLKQASFKGAPFYVEQQGRFGGRRVVQHEYPKREYPYAEDMGRQSMRYQMQGYVLQGPGPLPEQRTRGSTYQNMYIEYYLNRDALCQALDAPGPGPLSDPYNPDLVSDIGYDPQFVCERYTMTEARERGGFAMFEMFFGESGIAGNSGDSQNTGAVVTSSADAMALGAIQTLLTIMTMLKAGQAPSSGPVGSGFGDGGISV
jgi:hypothetical protein